MISRFVEVRRAVVSLLHHWQTAYKEHTQQQQKVGTDHTTDDNTSHRSLGQIDIVAATAAERTSRSSCGTAQTGQSNSGADVITGRYRSRERLTSHIIERTAWISVWIGERHIETVVGPHSQQVRGVGQQHDGSSQYTNDSLIHRIDSGHFIGGAEQIERGVVHSKAHLEYSIEIVVDSKTDLTQLHSRAASSDGRGDEEVVVVPVYLLCPVGVVSTTVVAHCNRSGAAGAGWWSGRRTDTGR